jgi:hypothetical protein
MDQYHDIAERWKDYLVENKQRKPQCLPGNASHFPADHPKAGQFAPAGQKGSWSIGMDPSDANKGPEGCRRGIRRKTGRGEESRAVKKPCGRLNKKSANKKAPNLCSVKERLLSPEDDDVLLVRPDDLQELVLAEIERIVQKFIATDEEALDEVEGARPCPSGCHRWQDVLKAINAAVLSSKGQLEKAVQKQG